MKASKSILCKKRTKLLSSNLFKIEISGIAYSTPTFISELFYGKSAHPITMRVTESHQLRFHFVITSVAGHGGRGAAKGKRGKSADKPGSVVGNHSSGTRVTTGLERPTRKRARIGAAAISRCCFPIWPCSRWGLPCRRLLPATRCALTAPFHPCRRRSF